MQTLIMASFLFMCFLILTFISSNTSVRLTRRVDRFKTNKTETITKLSGSTFPTGDIYSFLAIPMSCIIF